MLTSNEIPATITKVTVAKKRTLTVATILVLCSHILHEYINYALGECNVYLFNAREELNRLDNFPINTCGPPSGLSPFKQSDYNDLTVKCIP